MLARPLVFPPGERPNVAGANELYDALAIPVWPSDDGRTLTHVGALPGTYGVAVGTPDQLVMVALFNGRPADDRAALDFLRKWLPSAAAASLVE